MRDGFDRDKCTKLRDKFQCEIKGENQGQGMECIGDSMQSECPIAANQRVCKRENVYTAWTSGTNIYSASARVHEERERTWTMAIDNLYRESV